MGFITHSDIINSINYHMSEKFRNYAEIFDYNNQIFVLIRPVGGNTETLKFNEIMDYLSFKRTWFYREEHATENLFERALASLDMPLKVRECQRTIFVTKPIDSEPLDKFLSKPDSTLREVYEMREKLKACYEIVDKSLTRKKKFSYVERGVLSEEQRSLLDFYEGQLTLDYFLIKSQPTKKHIKKSRNIRWRKIRFDMVFEVPEMPALIFAEVKMFPTLKNSEIKKRANQLLAYDAWLKTKEDEAYTPMLYILPTIVSHKEISLLDEIKERTRREIMPVCVSTSSYLREDLKRRRNRAEIVEKASTKYEMDPAVVNAYNREYEYLEEAINNLEEASLYWR